MVLKNKLWGGRFSTSTSTLMEQFSQSVSFDFRLYNEDIDGSIAHARMLAATGVISDEEFGAINQGLEEIRAEIAAGEFDWSLELEDVHMNIEAALTARIGDSGKKLHTGRSRNDQVATDLRLYLRHRLDSICDTLTDVQGRLIELAEAEASTVMPGLTHMQIAQPVTFGHHVLAWNEMLERDYHRFRECRGRLNICPLGSAALAGTGFPIDREMTRRELGFDSLSVNSLDAVSDRDFAMEFCAVASLFMVHLSRIAEELVLWSSDGFGFIDLGEQFCTGSSIMPQKKNPDVAELARGKSGRVIGNLTAMLVLMKSQPLAYNRDNQEDKEPVFDTVDTVQMCLDILAELVPTITVNREAMLAAAKQGYATATDLADYLVLKGIPFRDAHEIVGGVVGHALETKRELEELDLDTLKKFCDAIGDDVYQVLDPAGSVAARSHPGGTAPERVAEAADEARKLLDARPKHPV